MMSVFTLLSAFTGAMSLAMDTVAGERERRSLLPLLLGAVAPGPVLIGKWLATCAFAVAGLLISLGGFTAVFALVGAAAVPRPDQFILWMAPPLLALAFTAMALELLVSTACRTTKDAHTWLSILVFVMMALTMWLAFHPSASQGWWLLVPIAGQQRLLETAFLAGHAPPLQSAGLTLITTGLAIPVLIGTRRRLQSDDVLYGR
jgi:sodium transport system permease protein